MKKTRGKPLILRKPVTVCCGLTLLISLILNSFVILADYSAVSANGSDHMLWLCMYLVIPLLGIFILIPASLIGLIFRFSRKACFVILLCCIVYYGGATICGRIAERIRMAAFHELAERSDPLVQAIKNYEVQYEKPPARLADLVPEFLPRISGTGMGAYPGYKYMVGDEAQKFAEDAWCLVVYTPLGGLNWDMFIYFPNQNYPEQGYGGNLEKVRDWAYVHE